MRDISPTITLLIVVAVIGWSFALYFRARMLRLEDQTRTVRNLQASNDSLLYALGQWIDRAQRAEAVVADVLMEQAEERAREDRIWHGVMRRVHMEHSPIAVTFPDAVLDSDVAASLLGLCIGEREVDE